MAIRLKVDELKFCEEGGECTQCGHLQAFHNYHCCEFCQVPGCKCEGHVGPFVPRTERKD